VLQILCGYRYTLSNPEKGGNKMGAMKQIDVQFQEAMHLAMTSQNKELADTVAWYRAHFDKLPAALMRAILTDDEFFQKAVTVWDNERFAPKPASEHVALQVPLVSRRDLREPKRVSYRCALTLSLIGAAVITGVALLVVAL
jgi:hypothetical protein